MLKPALITAQYLTGILALVFIGAMVATGSDWAAHKALLMMGCYLLAERVIRIVNWSEEEVG